VGTASVALSDGYGAGRAARAWRAAGLEFQGPEHREAHEGILGLTIFTTEEETYDFTDWFETVYDNELEGVRTIRGRAVSLNRDGDRIDGLAARIQGENVRLTAGCYVLTAGTSNLDLVSTATPYRGEAINRVSHMLVLCHPELEPLTLVVPDPRLYGLFLVSRQDGATRYWLASDFISFSGDLSSEQVAAMWVRSVVRNIERATGALPRQQLTWRIYPAAKGELRPNRGRLDIHRVQQYGLRNLLVASPSKLTLAPLLADQLAELVGNALMPEKRWPSESDAPTGVLGVSQERWRSARVRPVESLIRVLRGANSMDGLGAAEV
jgi:hypothetical protein